MTERVNSLRRRLGATSRSIFERKKYFVFERIIADGCFKLEAKVGVDVRLVQCDDFPKFAKGFKKFKRKKKKIWLKAKERFEMGHICIVADMHGDFVHLKWVAFNEAYVSALERKLRISSNSAYMYDSYTVPEYRELGIARKATRKAFSYLYERGIRKVYACIHHNNFPSLRAAHKVGFREIGKITYTRIFKLRLYRCEGETEENYNKLKEMFSI